MHKSVGETDVLNSMKCFHGANNIFNSKSKKLEIVITNGVQKLYSVMCSSVIDCIQVNILAWEFVTRSGLKLQNP